MTTLALYVPPTLTAINTGIMLAAVRGHACCACGSASPVTADHVRPRHAGGATIPANLAPLCDLCNKVKSCFWPGHGYHPLRGFDDITHADLILDAEIVWLREHWPEPVIAAHIWQFYGRAA